MAERESSLHRLRSLSVLGLGPAATEADVRAAHRRLALRYHPDKAGADALGRFLAVQAAYEDLEGDRRATARTPIARRTGPSSWVADAVRSAPSGRSERRTAWSGGSFARGGPAWGAEPGWKGGAWYWEDIGRGAAAGARHQSGDLRRLRTDR